MSASSQHLAEQFKPLLWQAFQDCFWWQRGKFQWRDEQAPIDETAAHHKLAMAGKQLQRLQEEVEILHEGFTSNREERGRNYMPKEWLWGGYQLYYLPRNLSRIAHLLQNLNSHLSHAEDLSARLWATDPQGVLSILDLGCGLGAWTLALLQRLNSHVQTQHINKPKILRIVLVDQSRPLLRLTRRNIELFLTKYAVCEEFKIVLHSKGVQSYFQHTPAQQKSTREQFQWIGSAFLLNELLQFQSRRLEGLPPWFLQGVIKQLAPAGRLFFVEPGTREGYEIILALRQELLPKSKISEQNKSPIKANFRVVYPCPHTLACPLVKERKQAWCHASAILKQPFFFDPDLQIQKVLQKTETQLHYAGLLLLDDKPNALPSGESSMVRVLSDPMPLQSADNLQKSNPEMIVLTCEQDGKLQERPLSWAKDHGEIFRGAAMAIKK